jgi:hypothetical protein
MRGSDVMGNIGEIPCQRDVNGRLAAAKAGLGNRGRGSERVCGISEAGLMRPTYLTGGVQIDIHGFSAAQE